MLVTQHRGTYRPLTARPTQTVLVAKARKSQRERDLAKSVRLALAGIASGITVAKIVAAIKAGSAKAVKDAFNNSKLESGMDAALDHLADEFEAAAKQSAKGLGSAYDVADEAAQAYVKDRGAALVVEITTGTRDNLKALVAKALRDTVHPYDVAPVIRQAVTLHSRWAMAVYNYHQGLLASGADPERAAALAGRYYDRLLTLRSENIARTEMLSANNAGRLDAWVQAAGSGLFDADQATKTWIAAEDERTCPVCGDLDGEEVGMQDLFSSGDSMPPAHPSCRCTASLVTARGDMRQTTEAA